MSRVFASQTVQVIYYSCFQFRPLLIRNDLARLRQNIGSTFEHELFLRIGNRSSVYQRLNKFFSTDQTSWEATGSLVCIPRNNSLCGQLFVWCIFRCLLAYLFGKIVPYKWLVSALEMIYVCMMTSCQRVAHHHIPVCLLAGSYKASNFICSK